MKQQAEQRIFRAWLLLAPPDSGGQQSVGDNHFTPTGLK